MTNTYEELKIKGQKGSALVIVLLVLAAVTAIGVLAMRSSTIDLDIAANDKCSKATWWATDGGNQMTSELIEQNIEDRAEGWMVGPYGPGNQVGVYTPNFYLNEEDADCLKNVPSRVNRDIKVPGPGLNSEDYGSTEVFIKVYGNTQLSTGSALQIAAGDKGRGKGMAGGGAQVVYDIRGFGDGAGNCESRILMHWRHLL